MNFGVTPYQNLSVQDFVFTKKEQPFLSGVPVAQPRIYIGLPAWGGSHLAGSLYPAKASSKDFLKHYSHTFNAIELNASHYHIPSKEQVNLWLQATKDREFHFCPKFLNLITHRGGLNQPSKFQITDQFIERISGFQSKLGPSFIQLHESVQYQSVKEVISYLNYLPPQLLNFVEVRHPSWFSSKDNTLAFAKELNMLQKGWVITDAPGRQDANHQILTIPHAFIRFVAQGYNEIDLKRVQVWKEQLSFWYSLGLQSCHFFIHIHNKEEEAKLALHIQSELNAVLKL